MQNQCGKQNGTFVRDFVLRVGVQVLLRSFNITLRYKPNMVSVVLPINTSHGAGRSKLQGLGLRAVEARFKP